MILILSKSDCESTTNVVMDWLEAAGKTVLRLNAEDLETSDFALDFEDGRLRLQAGSRQLSLDADDVEAVWFRKWWPRRPYERAPAAPAPLHHFIAKHLSSEFNVVTQYLFTSLADKAWLCQRGVNVNKLHVLETARRVGLDIPPTLVTRSRDAVLAFADRHGDLIVKALGDGTSFGTERAYYPMFTEALSAARIAALPAEFHPSLFQARVTKRYELRVFFLDGECHAMAIFSQGNAKTALDFRHYDRERPNRWVPFKLPTDVETRIRALMERLRLDTGSLDLIRADDGRYVFLEVNPAGQFGMVSGPCNYHLEKRVADALLRRTGDDRRTP